MDDAWLQLVVAFFQTPFATFVVDCVFQQQSAGDAMHQLLQLPSPRGALMWMTAARILNGDLVCCHANNPKVFFVANQSANCYEQTARFVREQRLCFTDEQLALKGAARMQLYFTPSTLTTHAYLPRALGDLCTSVPKPVPLSIGLGDLVKRDAIVCLVRNAFLAPVWLRSCSCPVPRSVANMVMYGTTAVCVKCTLQSGAVAHNVMQHTAHAADEDVVVGVADMMDQSLQTLKKMRAAPSTRSTPMRFHQVIDEVIRLLSSIDMSTSGTSGVDADEAALAKYTDDIQACIDQLRIMRTVPALPGVEQQDRAALDQLLRTTDIAVASISSLLAHTGSSQGEAVGSILHTALAELRTMIE